MIQQKSYYPIKKQIRINDRIQNIMDEMVETGIWESDSHYIRSAIFITKRLYQKMKMSKSTTLGEFIEDL